jgi:hypothetical protein
LLKLEEWERPDDPEESPTMAGVVAGAETGDKKKIIRDKKRI